MSMISAQIDKLRKYANKADGTFPMLANALRDAADTIWQLRDDLQRANAAVQDAEHDESMAWDRVRKADAENAKLRSQCADLVDDRERLFQANVEKNGEVLRLVNENANLRELATFALKHIIEFECEKPDRERFRGKPCEDCADYGSSDCPKCMPRMFNVLGIEVDG